MLIASLIGYLIGLAIISTFSGAVMSLTIRLFYKQKSIFGTAFILSFLAFLAALFVDKLVNDAGSQSSLTASLPGIVFFVASWLLNALLIKYDSAGTKSYGKAFLVTIVQCVALFIFILFLTFGLMATISPQR